MLPLYPVGRPVAAERSGSSRRSARDRRTRSRPASPTSVKSNTDSAALIPRLHHDVAARAPGSAIRCARRSSPARSAAPASCSSRRTSACRSTMSKMASAPQFEQIGRAAARPRAAAPLVGEDHLGAVVVERRRVPVGEVLVATRSRAASGSPDREMSSRMPLPEQAPAARPTSGNTVMSWHWLVIARRLRARAVIAALLRGRRWRRSSCRRKCAGG